MQARQGCANVAPRSAPEHLSGGGGTGPKLAVEVGWVRLFRPEEVLAAENKVGTVCWDTSEGVERVALVRIFQCFPYLLCQERPHLLPGLKRITPAVTVDGVAYPAPTSAIEIKVFISRMNDAVPSLRDFPDILSRYPYQDCCILYQVHIVSQEKIWGKPLSVGRIGLVVQAINLARRRAPCSASSAQSVRSW